MHTAYIIRVYDDARLTKGGAVEVKKADCCICMLSLFKLTRVKRGTDARSLYTTLEFTLAI